MLSQGGVRKRQRPAMNTDTRDNGTTEVQQEVTLGAGDQHNNFGDGNQNNNTGLGSQFNAHSMSFVNKKNDKFLTDLRITDPRDDKVRIQRTKGGLLVDSCRWILDHEGFIRWRAEKRLLWIKGGPGKGKTMLLCGMIDELLALGYKSTFFFFCQATDARLNSATAVLRGLLYVILDNNPPLLDLLRDKYDKAGAGIFKDVNSWDVLSRMLVTALHHESMRHVVLVIDALDECISDLDHLISFLIDLPAHVKVIASSRPELRIDRGLAAALDDTKIYLSLELNENVITAAVNCYINHKVDKLAILKDIDHETRTEVREYLATKANSTFLWVSLVYEQLADNRVAKRHIKRKLYEFPQGLDSLYKRILDKILNSLDAEECRQILATMSIVSRPLHLAELALLLDHIDFLSELVEECSSLLTIRGEVVYFVHQSAKDYLLGQASEILPLGIGHGHSQVLSKLLGMMSGILRRNIYNIDKHGTAFEDILVPIPDPLASAQYACVYWADHLKTDNVGAAQFEEVYTFICEHFLHWCEALSLLRSLNEGILSVFKIQQIIEASDEPSEGKLLVRDAVRFVRYFRVAIEVDPMQVYLAALVFSPRKSIIGGLFQDEGPNWPLKPAVAEDWSLCVQTFEGHRDWVKSVAFSSDQSMLASSSRDGAVKLWNTVTGHCVRTLSTCNDTILVAISATGTLVASVTRYWDSAIGVWNIMTGHCVQKMTSPRGKALALAFLSDGNTLAFTTTHGIQLWDTRSGQCVQELEVGDILSASFSGDGSLVALAFGAPRKPVEVRQTATGFYVTTINHNSAKSVAISHDGLYVASICSEQVKVSNITTGRQFNLLEDKALSSTQAIAISCNGDQVALSLQGGDIGLWDKTTNECARVLVGHRTTVQWMTFSKDDTLLASVDNDRSIKLWDLTKDQTPTLSRLYNSIPNDVSDSGPCQRNFHRLDGVRDFLSSLETSLQKPRHVVSAATSEAIHSTDTHQHEFMIESITLACNSTRFVTLSKDRICVWDTESGRCLLRIQNTLPRASSATIFNENVHVASIAGRRIQVSDESAGRLLRSLELRPSISGHVAIPEGVKAEHRSLGQDMSSAVSIWIRFSDSEFELHTNFGTIDLESTFASGEIVQLKPQLHNSLYPLAERYYHTEVGKSWILKDGKKFLWLPPEYRPDIAKSSDSAIAMGFNSGRVIIMRFH